MYIIVHTKKKCFQGRHRTSNIGHQKRDSLMPLASSSSKYDSIKPYKAVFSSKKSIKMAGAEDVATTPAIVLSQKVLGFSTLKKI
jgi:hypothetical protein